MIFWKKKSYLKNSLLLPLQILSETFLILTRRKRDIIINVQRSWCQEPIIRVRLWLNLNFLDRVSKNTQVSNFMTIHPVGAELFHADGQTDMKKLTVAFLNFANAPKG